MAAAASAPGRPAPDDEAAALEAVELREALELEQSQGAERSVGYPPDRPAPAATCRLEQLLPELVRQPEGGGEPVDAVATG
jgi:hypothetical protein